MVQYESIFIADPGATEDEVGAIVKGVEDTIQAGNGKVLKIERWGKRRLAYRVGKHNDGVYTLVYLECESDLINELERKFRMNDRIIKYMTVKSKDTLEETAPEEAKPPEKTDAGEAPPAAGTSPANSPKEE